MIPPLIQVGCVIKVGASTKQNVKEDKGCHCHPSISSTYTLFMITWWLIPQIVGFTCCRQLPLSHPYPHCSIPPLFFSSYEVIYFLLAYSCFTRLCQFQLYSKVIQHIHFFFGSALWLVGTWFPDQGLNLGPQHWQGKHGVLNTGPPEDFQHFHFKEKLWENWMNSQLEEFQVV